MPDRRLPRFKIRVVLFGGTERLQYPLTEADAWLDFELSQARHPSADLIELSLVEPDGTLTILESKEGAWRPVSN